MPLGYFTDSTPLTPLRDPFNVLVDGINANETAIGDVENVRQVQTFRWADATERAAQTGMVAGDIGYQIDTSVRHAYSGTEWRPIIGQHLAVATRTATTPTLNASTFTNLSADANWTGGGSSYSNGWVAPFTGIYQIGWEINVAAAIVAGIAVNKSTAAFTDLLVQASADVIGGVAAASASGLVSLAEGDIVRLFAIAGAGTPALRAGLGRFTLMNVG